MSTEPINTAQEALATKAVPPVLSDNPIVKKIVEETGASQMGDVAKVASQRGQLDLLPPEFEPLVKKIKEEEGKAKVAEDGPRAKSIDADVLAFVAANIAANSEKALAATAESGEPKDKFTRDFMKLLQNDPAEAMEMLRRREENLNQQRDQIYEERKPGAEEIADILTENKDKKRLIECLNADKPDPNLTPEELATWERYKQLMKEQAELAKKDQEAADDLKRIEKLRELTEKYDKTTDPAERAKLQKEMEKVSDSIDDDKEDRKKEMAATTNNHEAVAKSEDKSLQREAKQEQAYEQKRAEGSKAAGNDDEYGDTPVTPQVAATEEKPRIPSITIDGNKLGPESALLSKLGEPMEGAQPSHKPNQGPDIERKQPPTPSTGMG